LRARLFVDLYNVVRHGIRASVESYSIKKLEPLYRYEREVALPNANSALSKIQAALELGDHAVEEQDRRVVQGYNRDDCLSTWRLRFLRREMISVYRIFGGTTRHAGFQGMIK